MGDLGEGPQGEFEEEKHIEIPPGVREVIDRIIRLKSAKQTIAACLIGVMLAGGSIYYYNYRNMAYAVKYQGRLLGYVKKKEAAVQAFSRVKEQIKTHDSSIDVDGELVFEKVTINPDKLGNADDMVKDIESGLYIANTHYAITVNGEEIAVVTSEDEAKEVVEGIKKYYQEEETKNGAQVLNINIKDDIKFSEKIVDESKVVDAKTAIDKLIAGKGTTTKYEVKSGDSIWRIAQNNGMSVEQIAAVNPGLNVDKLQIGQKINLAVSEPYLNVETTVKAEFDENIQYDTKYVEDKNLYRGQTKVVESGQYGINKVMKEITKLNGKEIAVSILNSAVVKNPVTRVLAKGTKQLVGSGQFQWPASGHITSGFASRGGSHRGVDIAAPRGTPIYASDSGTVVYSGWYYGYGNLVRVSHGNGYETYYGHCSTLLVKVGDTVKRGQHIANVGSTGDSTGSHVHFEVRVNGSTKNPLNYLK